MEIETLQQKLEKRAERSLQNDIDSAMQRIKGIANECGNTGDIGLYRRSADGIYEHVHLSQALNIISTMLFGRMKTDRINNEIKTFLGEFDSMKASLDELAEKVDA